MIGKVGRGSRVGGLLRYLFGPGRANEHTDPRVVASWDGSTKHAAASDDVRRLRALLEQPAALLPKVPEKLVWHCSLRAAPSDRHLTDAEWAEVAGEVAHRTGLAPRGDDGGCRWVAVRHADDHVHLVVTLARQDGRPARTSNDFYRVGEACRWAETRFGLRATAPRDRTAARRATRAEQEKSARAGRAVPARDHLRRQVRLAAARSSSPADFLARLSAQGLLVRERRSTFDPGQVTGYAVALPGDRNQHREPVWFSGGKLAPDLTLPKLTRRWGQDTRGAADLESGRDRDAAWSKACAAAVRGTASIERLALTRPDSAADAAHATSGALACAAHVIEGGAGGPLTDASEVYDRAARELWGRTPRRTAAGDGLRTSARTLARNGRARRSDSQQALELVTALAALVAAVSRLRDVQQRSAQAAAARQAVAHLHRAAPLRPSSPPPARRRHVPRPHLEGARR